MKTLKIRIVENKYGSLFAYDGFRELFQFEERGLDDGLGKGQWFFWPKGNYNPTKFKGAFPKTYFINLCKAFAFILGNEQEIEMADEVEIVEGEDYIS